MQELLESLQGTEKYSYNNEAILCPIPLSQLNQRKKKRLKIVILSNKGINELSIPSINILYLTAAFVNHKWSKHASRHIHVKVCSVEWETFSSRVFCWQHFYCNSIQNKLHVTQTAGHPPMPQGTSQDTVLMFILIFFMLIIIGKKHQQSFSRERSYMHLLISESPKLKTLSFHKKLQHNFISSLWKSK